MKTVRQLSLVMLTACLIATSASAQVTRGSQGNGSGPVYGSPVFRGGSNIPAQPNGYGERGNRGNRGNGNYGNRGNGNYGNPGNFGNGRRGGITVHVQTGNPPYYGQTFPPIYVPPVYNQSQGPCTIQTSYNGHMAVYTVYDAYGSVMITTPDYNQAYQVALNSVANRVCSYVASNGNGNGNGNPYPQSFCQIMPGQNAYGQVFYRVVDRAGRILLNTGSYSEAQFESQRNPACFQ